MSEVGEAVQVLMITEQTAVLLGNMAIKTAMLIAKVMNTIYLSKWQGATTLNRFRNIKGDNFAFVNAATEDNAVLQQIEKELTDHGILFARLPDLCGGDGRTQYVISPSDMEKFKAFLLDHNNGAQRGIKVGLIGPEDYVQTAVQEDGALTPEYSGLEHTAEAQRLTLSGPAQFALPENPQHYQDYFPVDAQDTVRLYDYTRRNQRVEWIKMEPAAEGERWNAYRMDSGDLLVIPKEDIFEGKIGLKPDGVYCTITPRGEFGRISGEDLAQQLRPESERRQARQYGQDIIYSPDIAWVDAEPEIEGAQWNAYRLSDQERCIIPKEEIAGGKVKVNKAADYYVVNNAGEFSKVDGAQLALRLQWASRLRKEGRNTEGKEIGLSIAQEMAERRGR